MVLVQTKKGPVEVPLTPGMTVFDLKAALQISTGLHIHRQGLKVLPAAGGADAVVEEKVVRLVELRRALSEYGVSDASVLVLSDLGPQIGYRTVFIVEVGCGSCDSLTCESTCRRSLAALACSTLGRSSSWSSTRCARPGCTAPRRPRSSRLPTRSPPGSG